MNPNINITSPPKNLNLNMMMDNDNIIGNNQTNNVNNPVNKVGWGGQNPIVMNQNNFNRNVPRGTINSNINNYK